MGARHFGYGVIATHAYYYFRKILSESWRKVKSFVWFRLLPSIGGRHFISGHNFIPIWNVSASFLGVLTDDRHFHKSLECQDCDYYFLRPCQPSSHSSAFRNSHAGTIGILSVMCTVFLVVKMKDCYSTAGVLESGLCMVVFTFA
jgi:hypothetical protein